MPAFDPVRDAASVSPTTSTMIPLPPPLPPASPTRRQSSLSMLLNADTPDESRPGSSSSTYSQNSLYGSPFPASSNGFPKPALSSIDTANLARQPSQSPTMQPRSALVPASPLSMLIHPNLPPHSQSPTLSTRRSPYPPPGPLPSNNHFPAPMPPPMAIPYQPLQQKRKSRTASVLVPITPEEARSLKQASRNSLRRDPFPVASSSSSSHPNGSPYLQSTPHPNMHSPSPAKRKYEPEELEQQEHERAAKRSRDTLLVADHCEFIVYCSLHSISTFSCR